LSLSRKLGFIALLYVVEGFPMGVYQEIWPVYFRAHGVSLTEIGLYSGLYFAWSLKVFWSPLVDRCGEKRQWIAAAMATMASALVALSWLPPGSTPLVWFAMGTFCIASATQDIAIDAYTIGLVERGQEGPANSVRVAAYRVGFLLAGGGLLLLPSVIGWNGTFVMGAILSGALAAAVFLCPRVDNPGRQERDANLWARWRDREGVVPVIAFVLLYRVGDRAMGTMVKPFWVDRGFSFQEIALYSTSFGIGATILGAIVGGVVVSRIGIYRSLWWLGGAAIASNLVVGRRGDRIEPLLCRGRHSERARHRGHRRIGGGILLRRPGLGGLPLLPHADLRPSPCRSRVRDAHRALRRCRHADLPALRRDRRADGLRGLFRSDRRIRTARPGVLVRQSILGLLGLTLGLLPRRGNAGEVRLDAELGQRSLVALDVFAITPDVLAQLEGQR
jgi:PAT family beta-lactamase induction signal transducer AmpG